MLKTTKGLRIEFKPQDLWVGLYWECKKVTGFEHYNYPQQAFHLWICIIPTIPIHLWYWK